MLLLLLDTALLLVLLARDAHLRRGRTQRDAIRRERRALESVCSTRRDRHSVPSPSFVLE
jgi:hypothetical protein